MRLDRTDTELLLIIEDLDPDAYGVPILKHATERLNRYVSIGELYTRLDRMETHGYVESWTGDATAERGWRKKRFYRVTDSGKRARQEAEATAEKARRRLRLVPVPGTG